MKKKTIAVFDVDGTLLKEDSLILAANYSQKGFSKIFKWLMLLPFFLKWKFNNISTKIFKEKFLELFDICSRVNTYGEVWIIGELLNQTRPEAIKRLLWHRAKGDRVILCSASPRIIISSLAKFLRAELVCTELEKKNNHWIPVISGNNIKGLEKVKSLKLYLENLDDYDLEFYGDSEGDKEILQISNKPHFRNFSDENIPYPPFSFTKIITTVAITIFIYGLFSFFNKDLNLLPLINNLLPQIIIGLFLVIFGYIIRFVRWHFMLRIIGYNPHFIKDAKIWMSSFAFTATPGKSGEIVRSILLKKECNLPLSATLGTLLVERITDATAVILLLFLNLPLVIQTWNIPLVIQTWNKLIFIIFNMVGILLTFYFFFNHIKFKRSLINFFKNKLPNKLSNSSTEFVRVLNSLTKFKVIICLTLIGSLAWSLEGISLWLLLEKLGQNQVKLGYSIVTHTSAGLIGVLSMLPGGIGSTETSMIGLLGLKGVNFSIASSLTVINRLMTLWFGTLLGLVCLLIPSKSD